jgi:sulfate adenylyltransferase
MVAVSTDDVLPATSSDPRLSDAVSRLTAWHPPRDVLEIVELAVEGAVPGPVLTVDEAAAVAVARDGALVIEDAEGTPVALLQSAQRLDGTDVEGSLVPARAFTHGPLRRHRRTPDQVHEMLDLRGPGSVLAVPVDGAMTSSQVEEVAALAVHERAHLLWLVLIGHGRRRDLPPEALYRAVRDAAEDVEEAGAPGVMVPVALPAGYDVAPVAHAFGAHLVLPLPSPGGHRGGLHPASARELERSVPPASRRGVTVFFTGLSGSGKSTVAKALAEHLLDDGRRDVSMLDGDEVRRLLSAGLGFSRVDRDLNIRRIGYVAAEITRHGGMAICAPIAPFAAVRQEVRAMVGDVGDFVLVHVSTPLAECERRDRKGLYAKARAGLIPEFTGVSSPYEEPADADLVLDTSRQTLEESVSAVWQLLDERGYLGPVDTRR